MVRDNRSREKAWFEFTEDELCLRIQRRNAARVVWMKMCKEHCLWVNVQSDELGSQIITLALPVGHAVGPIEQSHRLCVITVRRVFREGVVEPRIDEEIPKARMMCPMHKSGKISRHVIALGLFRTLRIQVQTGIHVDNTGLNGNERDIAGVSQDVVPTGECRGRDFIRRDNETMESTPQQVSGCGHSGNNRKYRKQPDLSKHSQNASGSLL